MTPRTLRRFCKLDAESEKQMENAITKLGLSARAYDRILKVSRTIADLQGSEKIQACHVSKPSGTPPSTAPTGSKKSKGRPIRSLNVLRWEAEMPRLRRVVVPGLSHHVKHQKTRKRVRRPRIFLVLSVSRRKL
jgi:hypothetical protein